MRQRLRRLITYLQLTDTLPQIRRYVVLGVFDGLLVALSIVTAAFARGLSSETIWTTGLSSVMAVVIASAWNTIQAEVFERVAELRKIERTILRPLRGTVLDHAHKVAAAVCVLVHALAPLAGLLILYIYTLLLKIIPDMAFYITLGVAGTLLALLGLMYVRELSVKDVVKLSSLMASAAISLVAVILLLLGPPH